MRVVAAAPASDPRRAALLEAATGVFLRYGFKKTSMEALARAAGLSRQGLYLHFATKEALFKEAVLWRLGATRAAGKAALAREDLDLPERLCAAFDAVHGFTIGQLGAEHLAELLETASTRVGPVLRELEEGIVGDVARALRGTVAQRWKEAGVCAKDLAEQLYAASYGFKHRVRTQAEYRERMRVAVLLVCREK